MILKKRWVRVLIIILVLMCLLSTAVLFARAGGAGGSSGGGGGYSGGGSSGGGDGAIIYLIIWIFRMIPFPFNIIVFAALIFAFSRYAKKQSRDSQAYSSYNDDSPEEILQKLDLTQLDLPNQPFDRFAFLKKVETAFTRIQEGWSEQKLSGVRRFVSDGIYQRFQTQFKMMKILEQQNKLSDIKIDNVWIEEIENQGSYQIAHCGIRASITDKFISPLFPKLNSGGREEFTEYWSFIRKNNAGGKDMYGSTQCPSCGAPLEGENLDVVSCPFCSSLLNSGSFDWILSEITQSDDWAASKKGLRRVDQVARRITAKIEEEDFSVQLLEDKASNGYLQIKTALTLGKPELMKRFVTADLYNQLAGKNSERIAFSRIYLNHVTLSAADTRGDRDRLFVAIKSSYQRVQLVEGKKPRMLDSFMSTHQEMVELERDKNAVKAKGSLYGDRCPGCGAAVENSTALECGYCGELYNSGKSEWVISRILTMEEYRQIQKGTEVALDNQALDSLYHVKDYVLNNMMYIIAADGTFANEERVLAEKVVRKLGYSLEQLQPLFDRASSGNLVLKMPESQTGRMKIYKMMEKFALSDHQLSSEERQILDEMREKYGLSA